MSSFSSVSFYACKQKHHVFLSFRGEDTRNNFVDHLYKALLDKGIGAYIDSKELSRGEEISPALLKAIEESIISIIVFSQNYATSSWCLEELSKIMECRDFRGQLVVPIFYHVDPSDVRKQIRSFGKAFVEHERSKKDKVQRWRRALTQAGNLSGFLLAEDKPESEVIKGIVYDILSKLNRLSKSDHKGLIGMGPRMEQIMSLLCIGGEDVRIIGILGMGGIGKTTLAQAIYDDVSAQFESCCFLKNVREELERLGPITLQEKLLSQLLKEKDFHLGALTIGSSIIKDRLRSKKVLIVVDDVNNFNQLETLAVSHDHFGFGSRIIVTSRDRQVLINGSIEELIYEVKELTHNDSLQLFSQNSFKQNHPVADFMDLSNSFLEYAQGVPIALKVLGSTLYQDIAYWKSELNRLKQYPNKDIENVLKISFDGLGEAEKIIFLDIACFFKGYDTVYVTKLLDNCHDCSAHCGITKLIDKCLLNVTSWNEIGMHDLIQDMGRNVVRAESQGPEGRSRLWTPSDVCRVLKNGRGTGSIQGILLDQSQSDKIQLHPSAFANMLDLRIISFYGKEGKLVPLDPGLESLPNELRYLEWDYCMLKSLPSNFSLENLVELRLPHSNVQQLWNGEQNLVNLRVLYLSYCENLTRIPDLSTAINLQTLRINGCKSLVELPSMMHLNSLECDQEIRRCNNLKKFPELPQHTKSLFLRDSAIVEIPESIGYLNQLEQLTLIRSRVKTVSKNICELESVTSFDLEDCQIFLFPEVPRNLRRLNLQRNQIEEVPSSIGCLDQLAHLDMRGSRIHNLPCNIFKLDALKTIKLSDCPNITEFPNVPENIEILILDNTPIKELPSSVSRLKCIYHLSLRGCTKLRSLDLSVTAIASNLFGLGDSRNPSVPSNFCDLVSLKKLNLSGSGIVEIPKSIKQLSNLIALDLRSCKSLQSLPELPPCLGFLDAGGCTSLKTVSKWEQEQFQNMTAAANHRFLFNNCSNLDPDAVNNIVTNAQLRTQCMAEEFRVDQFGHPSRSNYKYIQSVIFCLPGKEISETFKNKSTNSSIAVQLNPASSYKRFLGFAFCIVVDFVHRYKGTTFKVSCNYRFKTKCGHLYNYSFSWYWPDKLVKNICLESNHVFLLFDGFRSGIIDTSRKEQYDEASFEFYIDEHVQVQKCGVNVFSVDGVGSESAIDLRFHKKVVDLTKETSEPSSRAYLSISQDEEKKCDASILEPDFAIDPNRLSVKCDASILEPDFLIDLNKLSVKCDAFMFEPDSAIDPNRLLLKCGASMLEPDSAIDQNRLFVKCDTSMMEPDSAIDLTRLSLTCDANWLSLKCDAARLEPDSAIDPNRLSQECDFNNRDFEGPDHSITTMRSTTMRSRLKRSFGSEQEEEPDPRRLKY